MNQLEKMIMPEVTSLEAKKLDTITLSSDMSKEGAMNAPNMVLNVKNLTFIDFSGNRRTLSGVIEELSNSIKDLTSNN